ncbi:hypothetical protein BD410DRAFT_741606 [Rickenella mellea]|uniref:FAS1 domain-containing protein n=1 Tax=Rickenella mellea TaxID=50990 RepID=A0A4Y7QFA1_9AGAM|nr:hypothetical protein BD410DRAFT_741606 [Rickenella mellea]
MHRTLLILMALPFMAASNPEQIMLNSPGSTMQDTFTPVTTEAPSLADILTIESSASIFYTYARETRLSELFTRTDTFNTILVPNNQAVMALARKPHQGPSPIDEDIKITEEEFDARSRQNVENWISAHIIPSRITLSQGAVYQTLREGCTVTVDLKDPKLDNGKRGNAVFNGNKSIISVREASNGFMYLIDGAIAA